MTVRIKPTSMPRYQQQPEIVRDPMSDLISAVSTGYEGVQGVDKMIQKKVESALNIDETSSIRDYKSNIGIIEKGREIPIWDRQDVGPFASKGKRVTLNKKVWQELEKTYDAEGGVTGGISDKEGIEIYQNFNPAEEETRLLELGWSEEDVAEAFGFDDSQDFQNFKYGTGEHTDNPHSRWWVDEKEQWIESLELDGEFKASELSKEISPYEVTGEKLPTFDEGVASGDIQVEGFEDELGSMTPEDITEHEEMWGDIRRDEFVEEIERGYMPEDIGDYTSDIEFSEELGQFDPELQEFSDKTPFGQRRQIRKSKLSAENQLDKILADESAMEQDLFGFDDELQSFYDKPEWMQKMQVETGKRKVGRQLGRETGVNPYTGKKSFGQIIKDTEQTLLQGTDTFGESISNELSGIADDITNIKEGFQNWKTSPIGGKATATAAGGSIKTMELANGSTIALEKESAGFFGKTFGDVGVARTAAIEAGAAAGEVAAAGAAAITPIGWTMIAIGCLAALKEIFD